MSAMRPTWIMPSPSGAAGYLTAVRLLIDSGVLRGLY
jgi:hypothetical protein